jgi:transcriptional regulator with XRE-family HTH domain
VDLREFRIALSWSQEDVAEAVGTYKVAISRLERRIGRPPADLVARVALWAELERKRRRLPEFYRLDWSYLQAPWVIQRSGAR